jgi:5-formyltetrahydrofolate cyclo-ligase
MSLAASKISQQQKKLRAIGIDARRRLSAAEREIASDKIAETVCQSAWFQRSKYVACYLGTTYEVDTWPIIARAWRMKKRIFAPVIEKRSRMRFRELTVESTLVSDRNGILQPVSGDFIFPRMLDLVLTPLVAFDAQNNRIGMGGGYFDRTFSFLRDRKQHFHPKLIGLAFGCQQVEKIAPNPWDIRLFSVISDF